MADYHSTKTLREIAALHGGGVSTHTRFCSNCSKGIISEDGAPSSDNNEILCIDCRRTHIRFRSCTQCERTFDLSTLTECEGGSLLCVVCTTNIVNHKTATNNKSELGGLPLWFDMEESDYREPGHAMHKLPYLDNIKAVEDDVAQDKLEGAGSNGLNGGLSGDDDTESNDGDGSLSIGAFSGGVGDVQDEEEVTPLGKFLMCCIKIH